MEQDLTDLQDLEGDLSIGFGFISTDHGKRVGVPNVKDMCVD